MTEDEVLHTAKQAFAGGWTAVKLYFMIGLPTETDEDIVGIAELARKVSACFYRLPKELIRDPTWQDISMEAKVLYGCMLDRHELSAISQHKRSSFCAEGLKEH